jgi:hypothetical protein
MMHKYFQLSPEDNLLVSCARKEMDDVTKDRINSLLRQDLDWNYFFALVSKHRLTPLVYQNLNKTDFKYIYKTFSAKFREYINQNAQKNLLMFSELFKILELFNSHGITAIPYKGPVLAIAAYNDLALREFSDLDIFIPQNFFFKAENLMKELGYKPVLRLKKEQKEIFIKFQREYKFINDKRIPVEIKWRFPVVTFFFREDPIILCDYEELSFNNRTLKTLKPENLLLVLCLHNAGHYWSNLRGICDVVEIADSENINWTICLSMAEKLGIKRIFFINLLLAHYLLDLTIPYEILLNLESDKSCKSISKQIKERFFSKEQKELTLFQKIIMRIYIRESYNDKLKDFFKMILVPTPSVLESVSLPKCLVFVYHFLRVLQLIKTYVVRKKQISN